MIHQCPENKMCERMKIALKQNIKKAILKITISWG
jgi:hypothetical protein